MSLIYTEEATTVGGTYKKRNSVYIGGRADAKDCEKLERWNVSHILNVTPTKEASIQAGVPNFFERTRKFKYKRIQVYDAPTSSQQLLDSASAIVNFISSGLFHGSVLIHCQHGVSRSTTCCVFYLMKKAGLSLNESLLLVKRRRPQAQPIPAFMGILKQYEKEASDNVGSNSDKKRKRVGPVITGPSFQKIMNDDTKAVESAKDIKIIGPSMPPKRPRQELPLSTNSTTSATIIGPAMPPSLSKKSTTAKLSTSSSIIGPILPAQS